VRERARATLAAVVAAGVLAALSGCAPGPSAVAELNRPATEDDRLPEDWDLTGSVFPSTIRFVGTVEEVEVYLALAPAGYQGWRFGVQERGVDYCLLAVESSGLGTACGRLPLQLQTSGVDLQLIGSGGDVPEGFERLSESVVVQG
jgi:hypothetical protein